VEDGSLKEVADKTAFVTGGASGIGLGMAQAFADAGMRVMIADIRRDHIDEAREWFAERQMRDVQFLELDVTDREAFAKAAEETERVFGKVHVLCNNAGMGVGGPIKNTKFDDWDWGLSVLLGGVVNGLTIFLPYILKHGEGGHIVNTSSTAALVPGGSVYATAKGDVMTLTESIAKELAADNIGVTAFMPGTIKSNIHQSGRTRPDKYRRDTNLLESEERMEAREVSPLWMEARDAGELVLTAIRENQLYLTTHVEFKAATEDRFKRILGAFPAGEPNPDLMADFARRMAAVHKAREPKG
jgi:NAD(P)-dependent dehydrogenase (short-subunit alcohol dehydrogenase family)